jgi:hypothetical protein
MRYILFQRDDCGVCDDALHILATARAPAFESRWIDGDPRLEERYGVRVPVLRDNDADRELEWPFDAQSARAFVAD